MMILFVISAGLSLAIAAGCLLIASKRGDTIVGQSFIDTELPPSSISPVYVKPVTILMVSGITAWYCTLELLKDRIHKLSDQSRSLMFLAAFLISAVTLYELAFNFMLWGVLLSTHSTPFNPDRMVNSFPSDQYKVNIVFATKIGATFLAGSLYSMYRLRSCRPVNWVVGS